MDEREHQGEQEQQKQHVEKSEVCRKPEAWEFTPVPLRKIDAEVEFDVAQQSNFRASSYLTPRCQWTTEGSALSALTA